MLRISLPTYLRTDTKALPTYLLNISIPEEFLSIYNPAPLGVLQEAIYEQTAIGWLHLFRGFFSKKWSQLSECHMVSADALPQKADGSRRMSTILLRVQGFINLIWLGRNETLHKQSKDEETKFMSLEAAEIRHYFNQPHLLPVTEQHYCEGSVLKILQSRPSNRRRWLRRVRKARSDLLLDQLRQARITSFFNRIRDSTPHSNTQENNAPIVPALVLQNIQHNSPQHQQTAVSNVNSRRDKNQHKTGDRTKQTRLHHFFPGRPPDDMQIQTNRKTTKQVPRF